MKVKVISLPYIFQVLYILCFTRPRYQVSVYRTIGPLVKFCIKNSSLYFIVNKCLQNMDTWSLTIKICILYYASLIG